MAFLIADRVQETSTTSGTGSLTLAGAVSGFQTFTAGIGDGNSTYYTIYDSTAFAWEVGIGTYTASGSILSRTTVLSNSLGTTALISFAANSKSVFVTYPAEKSVYGSDTTLVAPSGTLLPIANGGTGTATPALVAGTDITISGSWPNQTINSTGGGGGGGTPGGADTQIQYNNAGSFAGSADLTFNGTALVTANDAAINGVTVGKGGASVSTNVAIGLNALVSNTTGSANTACGFYALWKNTTGGNNTAAGMYTLRDNTGGSQSTAFGYSALRSNTTGSYNVATGYEAFRFNTTGSYNTASGYRAIYTNTVGGYNTASGYQALYSNTTGSYNTVSGYKTLYNNTTGSGNTALNPNTSAGTYAPVFNPTTENNRFCMGSTGVTNAYIQVAWTVVSDARDKTDFAPVPHGLDFVSKLEPTEYRYKMDRADVEGHGPLRYGFKAQDVLALEGDTPVIVDAEDLEKLRFNDQALIAVMVNAIKELNAKFDAYVATHP